jgi:hypothetical protein
MFFSSLEETAKVGRQVTEERMKRRMMTVKNNHRVAAKLQ